VLDTTLCDEVCQGLARVFNVNLKKKLPDQNNINHILKQIGDLEIVYFFYL
jgi:hypothetical protein